MTRYQLSRLVAVALIVFSTNVVPDAAARTIRVGSNHAYETLTEAVAASGNGDTLIVSPGTYHEYGIVIDHAMTLIGLDGATIDARGQGEIITVACDSVRIEGLTLCNVGTSFMEDRAAVRVKKAGGVEVSRCTLVDAFFGVYLEQSHHCVVRENTITASSTREVTSGNGIHAWYCRDIVIVDNVVKGHRDGIYFEFVNASRIERNHSEGNLRYGLHFMFSHNDEYIENRFVDNGAGVAVMYSHNVGMHGNLFEHNWGSASYGLLLKDIRDSKITRNTFHRNTVGAYAEGCNRISVHHNNFSHNGYAVKIMANSMDNEFVDNNFIGNTFDVTTNSRQNFNRFNANYWSAYRGYDLDRNGVGDVPHHPVRLFALITERQPPGLALLHSLFVEIIDTAERVMPVFTPETLVDASPRIEVVSINAK